MLQCTTWCAYISYCVAGHDRVLQNPIASLFLHIFPPRINPNDPGEVTHASRVALECSPVPHVAHVYLCPVSLHIPATKKYYVATLFCLQKTGTAAYRHPWMLVLKMQTCSRWPLVFGEIRRPLVGGSLDQREKFMPGHVAKK